MYIATDASDSDNSGDSSGGLSNYSSQHWMFVILFSASAFLSILMFEY